MKPRRNRMPDQSEEDRKRNDALNQSKEGPAEKSLPGEYPAKEDIMNRLNTQRVAMDVENFSRMIGTENFTRKEPITTPPNSIRNEPEVSAEDDEDRREKGGMERPVPRNASNLDDESDERSESDVTEEDLQALGPKDLSMDGGEDEQLLKNRVWPVDMAGEDLDVPGSELDDDKEAIGSEDEENNSYSLGGDDLEDKMEGK